ncbi:Glycosyl transferase family 11 [Thalassolituus maritimus]|uniref:Glycosyl transferase family 11 n=1 Tax=Thalassolituus maritimus TaxID=484498 RepID=A0A1N7N452_9GAMM|nr:alpha-1,2-fucosyltransferase [Thalassolituus maritimus]SIS92941.1 Glycosyl transferase family 11 [Thalassolituus maritimus]
MITIKLNGGLGNQLFQYSVGRALSLKYDVPLRIDASLYQFYDVHPFRLSSYSIGGSLYSRPGKLYKIINSIKVQSNLKKLNLRKNVYIEESIEYDPGVISMGADAVLYGYFQSEKYFSSIRDVLLKDLQIGQLQKECCGHIVNEIVGQESASLHVRRGDYVTNGEANKVHGLCGLNYIYESVSIIRNRVGNSHLRIFVFSDDIEWCRNNIELDNVFFVEGNDTSPEVDLYLMSLCSHNIIANSTFSWWGAWLNQNSKKIVICPRQWFRSNSLSDRDIVPDSWLRL